MTHDEIAHVLGISRCRVGQIEARAMKKLRAAFGEGDHGPALWFLRDWEGKRERVEPDGPARGDNGKSAKRSKGRFA
jgi:hypothetical protein